MVLISPGDAGENECMSKWIPCWVETNQTSVSEYDTWSGDLN